LEDIHKVLIDNEDLEEIEADIKLLINGVSYYLEENDGVSATEGIKDTISKGINRIKDKLKDFGNLIERILNNHTMILKQTKKAYDKKVKELDTDKLKEYRKKYPSYKDLVNYIDLLFSSLEKIIKIDFEKIGKALYDKDTDKYVEDNLKGIISIDDLNKIGFQIIKGYKIKSKKDENIYYKLPKKDMYSNGYTNVKIALSLIDLGLDSLTKRKNILSKNTLYQDVVTVLHNLENEHTPEGKRAVNQLLQFYFVIMTIFFRINREINKTTLSIASITDSMYRCRVK